MRQHIRARLESLDWANGSTREAQMYVPSRYCEAYVEAVQARNRFFIEQDVGFVVEEEFSRFSELYISDCHESFDCNGVKIAGTNRVCNFSNATNKCSEVIVGCTPMSVAVSVTRD